MHRLSLVTCGALAALVSLPAAAQTGTRLTCGVSGVYADGTRVAGGGTEDIIVDVRPATLSSPASQDVRVTANGRTYTPRVLKSGTDRVAFSYVSDATIDGSAQTLLLTYEVRLDQPRLRRTVMALFSSQFGTAQAAEGNCTRPAAAAAPAAPAAAATPAWVAELRRKLKECSEKDPFSQVSCNERMKARYCNNQPVKVPECE